MLGLSGGHALGTALRILQVYKPYIEVRSIRTFFSKKTNNRDPPHSDKSQNDNRHCDNCITDNLLGNNRNSNNRIGDNYTFNNMSL